jgi:GT2 family glycosyltransferase
LSEPVVYIIILSWNGKEDTLSCLRSIMGLRYPNFTVVMVDNASSDGTVESVKENFTTVKIIANSENLRFAGGNNVGIEYALQNKADYILLLNNDTIVDPDFLDRLIEVAASDKRIGIAGPKIYYYQDRKRIWFAGGKVEYWKGWVSHIGIRELDHGQYDAVRRVDYITGCCMLVRREVIERVGKLDEKFFIYGEDADLCLRASRAGYELVYAPSSMIWHKVSASSGGNLSWFKNWNKLKSQLRLMARYAKWYNWMTIPFGLAFNVLMSLLKAKRKNI